MSNEPTDLDEEGLESAKEDKSALIIEFWAEWCGACKQMEPVFESLAEDYGDDVFFGKVNVDDQRELATEYEVRSIPTIIFLKEGELVDKVIGSQPKEQMEKKIEDIF